MAVFYKDSIKHPLVRCLAAAASGLLLTLSFPKTGWSLLAWIGLAPLLFAVQGRSFWSAFRLGVLAGLVHYLTLMTWVEQVMRVYGYLPLYLSVPVLFLFAAYLSLYVGVFSGMARLCGKGGLFAMALPPFLWVALEYCRAWLFTGFPWGFLGHSQFECLAVIQIAELAGAYGVSFLIAAVNTGLFLFLVSLFTRGLLDAPVSLKKGVLALCAAGLLLGLSLAYGHLRLNAMDRESAAAKTVRVAVIQGNIDQNVKWNPAYQESTILAYTTLTDAAAAQGVDLVVWPESALPFYFMATEPFMSARILETAKRNKIWLVTGSMAFQRLGEQVKFFNSAFLVNPQGKSAGRYDKVHLVPWGEYTPLKKYTPFLGKMVEQVSDFSPGRKGQALKANGKNLGVLICYEIIFPALAREQVREGANLLLTITNDAWFGRSAAPHQHFSMAVLRAVENRRAVARAANTGISGFISPTGKILESTPLFEAAARTASLPLMDSLTPYARWGDIFAILCVILALAGMVMCRRQGA